MEVLRALLIMRDDSPNRVSATLRAASGRAADERDDLASFQLTKLHWLPQPPCP